MKLNAKVHGILDYVVVAFLLASPGLFNLPHTTALFTYALAGVHLLLTVVTDFPYGLVKLVPLRIHGVVELVVSIALVGVAFVLKGVDGAVAQIYYLAFAAAVFVTWLVTDYGHQAKV